MLKTLKDKNVYLAGPMTGIEDYNRRVFMLAHFAIRPHVLGLINPAFLPTTLAHYMPICLAMIDEADAVIFLPGWKASKGCALEFARANERGIPCFEYPNPFQKGRLPKLVPVGDDSGVNTRGNES